MAPKKQSTKTTRTDQYLIRLPDGMRLKLSKLAEANGRSMNAEIVSALEQHLTGSDRLSAIESSIQNHDRTVQELAARIRTLEDFAIVARFRNFREELQTSETGLTPREAAELRALLKRTGVSEARLLEKLAAPSIEEIKDFGDAVSALFTPFELK
ncbi:Arc family DNA-binding protein [Bradyrhizobium yuanmingense]|uniref:Arc family DNA-binding protein n=1 Tax=Bradyrhizobium yuanmingense TaxID=108015 RepID=UPI003515A5BA